MKLWHALKIFLCICSLLYSLYGMATLLIITNLSMYEWGFTLNKVETSNKAYYIDQLKNLRYYFLYNAPLNKNWTPKEQRHFSDIKNIFIKIVISTAFAIVLFLFLINKKIMKFVFFYSMMVQILIFALIYLFFQRLFMDLHELLFSNLDWIDGDPSELSYRIFNDEQFLYYGAFIIGLSFTINMILFLFAKFKDVNGNVRN